MLCTYVHTWTWSHIPGHGLRESAGGPVLAEEPVLQVNLGLPNQVVGRESVPVHHCDLEGVVNGQPRRQLKHLPKYGIQVRSDVIVFVVNDFLAD